MVGNHRASNPVFDAIAASQRRRILQLLLVRDSSVTEDDLSAHLKATEQRPPTSNRPADAPWHRELVHTQLPALKDAGLIIWDRETEAVDTALHQAFDDPRFQLLLETEPDGLDEVLSNLAHGQRRILLTVLRDAQTSMTRTDLARELLRSDTTELESDQISLEDAVVPLHHVHLPALDDAGLVDYDPESGRAEYTGHPALEAIVTIIYEPDEYLVDSCDGFFEGLEAACERMASGTGTEAEWPYAWRNPHHD